MTEPTVPPRRLWWLIAAFGVWGSAHVMMYTVHAVGCEFAWPGVALRLTLALILAAHLGVLVWMHFRLRAMPGREGRVGGFLHTLFLWSAIAATVATALSLGPALFLTTCA